MSGSHGIQGVGRQQLVSPGTAAAPVDWWGWCGGTSTIVTLEAECLHKTESGGRMQVLHFACGSAKKNAEPTPRRASLILSAVREGGRPG
jgi:hypothetical protein